MPSTGRARDSVSGWSAIVRVIGPNHRSSLVQARGVTGLGQRGNGRIRWDVSRGTQVGCSEPDFFDLNPFDGRQCLCDSTNAGATMHSIDPQGDFRHDVLLVMFDDTRGQTMRPLKQAAITLMRSYSSVDGADAL